MRAQRGDIGATVTGGSEELPLLGRARELAQLDAALAAARGGEGGLLLVTGEPGIGKTRLARAVGERAAADGARVAWARGWDGGGAPAYWPWLQVVRTLVRAQAEDELRAALGSGARWVAQVAPEVGDRLELAETPPDAGLDPEQARFALFDAVTVFLRRVAELRPLVLLLDDLHTADQSSLLLLAFLAREIGDAPVLVVSTHHDAGPRRPAEAEALFGELTRFGRRLELAGLGDGDVRRLIEHRAGAEAPDDLVRAVYALTDGNPFYSDEVVRLLVAQNRIRHPLPAGARLPLPDGVRDAIRRRLLPLDPGTIELLEAAAVVGRRFRLSTLQRAIGMAPETALDRLDEALAARLLSEAGEAGTYRFAHGLIRETLYGGLGAARRAQLHATVGETLERAGVGGTAPGVIELAHHFLQAAPAGGTARAVDYAERAGHEALRVLAYERAAELFDEGLRALELDEAPEPRRRGELLLARGQAQMHAGDSGARDSLMAAVRFAREAGDAELLGRAALGLGGFGLSPGMVDEPLVAILEEALDRLDPKDSPLRARLLVRLAVIIYWSDTAERRLGLVDEALVMARRLGEPATLAYVLDQGQVATSGPDSTEQGLQHAFELFGLAEEAGDPELAIRARIWHINLLLELDDLPAADMAIATLERIATDVRDPRARSYVPLHKARRALMEGRAEDAGRLIDEGVQLAWSLHDSTVPILAGAQLFSLRRHQGRLAELEDAVRQFADQLPAMPAWRCALAVLYLDAGREAEARREYERLAARGFASLPRDNVWLVALALLAEVCAALGDGERAPELEALLEPVAARNVVSPEGVFDGPVTRYLALLAAARGDWDAARERLADARARSERLNLRPMLALIALDEARMLVQRDGPGDRAAARRLLDRARALAGEAGAAGALRHIDALAERLAGDGNGVPAATGEELTAALRREGEVWTVHYEGRLLRLRDAKGLRHLALLLASPGIEFHALDIVAAAEGRAAADPATAEAARDAGLQARRDDDAGALLDDRAKAAYRERLEELRAEIAEAEAFNDPERAARAREELDFVARELSAAVGLGGRDRKASSSAERARVNVTRAVRSVIRRIAGEDARLAAELESTIHTGAFCRYQPDPRRPVAWEVEGV